MNDNSNTLKAAALALWLAAFVAQAAEPTPMYRSLYADQKAYRAGDILTVIITETASASATARTRADKSDSVAGEIRQPDERPWNIELGFSNDFTGGGEVQRAGRLIGRLAVLVEDIDEYGNLRVRGEQDIEVNNEKQRIALTGIVRPQDISPDNTVASWRIASAHIDFLGKGILARKQSPSLITKLFDLFGLN
jgi:flagellar L-ring protein precursor FlgH